MYRRSKARTTFKGQHINGASLRSSEIRRRNQLRNNYEFQKNSQIKNQSKTPIQRSSKRQEDFTIIGVIILGICWIIAKLIELIFKK